MLRALAPFVTSWQCDVPLDVLADEPDDVRAAAARLATLRPPRRRNPAYTTTGWVHETAGPLWEAFVTFAPCCYAADLWDAASTCIAAVDDSNSGVWMELTETQRAAAVGAVGGDRLEVRPPRRRWWQRRG